MITPERWLGDFERLEIDDEVKPLILKENAARLLELRSTTGKTAK
jgi:predicted TIM-barrel fold metal-dependent hydrolase